MPSNRNVYKQLALFFLFGLCFLYIQLLFPSCMILAEMQSAEQIHQAVASESQAVPTQTKSAMPDSRDKSPDPNQPPEKPCETAQPVRPLGFYNYTFYKSLGGIGLGEGYFQMPVDIGIDKEDNIYVCDKELGSVQVFDSEGDFDHEWERLPIRTDAVFNQTDRMDQPQAIYVAYKESIGKTFVYVADTGNNRILQFDKDGKLIDPKGHRINNTAQWHTMIANHLLWGGFGLGEGEFHHPADIAVDGHDNVYILDSRNDRIQCFDNTGKFKFEWGSFGSGPGSFMKPARLAYDPTWFDGNIWIIDAREGKIHKFDLDGTFNKTYIPKDKDNHPLPKIADLCFDTQGYIYLTDSTLNRVFKYNNDMEYIQCWGEAGSGPGQFKGPKGIAVDNDGRVLVVDSGNFRVQIFQQF